MGYGLDQSNITDCTFTNNTCYGALGEGAAISIGGMGFYKVPEPVITLRNTTFRDNVAELGACVSVTGGLQTIRAINSWFQNNMAAVYGGAFHAVLEYQGHLILDLYNTTFLNNRYEGYPAKHVAAALGRLRFEAAAAAVVGCYWLPN